MTGQWTTWYAGNHHTPRSPTIESGDMPNGTGAYLQECATRPALNASDPLLSLNPLVIFVFLTQAWAASQHFLPLAILD